MSMATMFIKGADVFNQPIGLRTDPWAWGTSTVLSKSELFVGAVFSHKPPCPGRELPRLKPARLQAVPFQGKCPRWIGMDVRLAQRHTSRQSTGKSASHAACSTLPWRPCVFGGLCLFLPWSSWQGMWQCDSGHPTVEEAKVAEVMVSFCVELRVEEAKTMEH
ncbi:unnamed protein product [Symbiodinium sp. CCMP2592]|nr:unnamed protein product [Symbiodinium sp. CCMP2592]